MQTTIDGPDTAHTTIAGDAPTRQPPTPTHSGYPAGGRRFDWIIVALGGWLIGGVHLDGWAHNHHPNLETFFTPWHAVLYSGFFALFLTLLFTFARNLGRGYLWRRALPVGYNLSLIGGCIFLIGGGLDLIWHQIFGIEANTEALLSPTHLVLATGGILMVSGPLRAAWQRPAMRRPALSAMLPAMLSLTFVIAMLAFFTQFAHPQVDTLATQSPRGRFVATGSSTQATNEFVNVTTAGQGSASSSWQAVNLGVTSILLQAILLSAGVLFLIRRWPILPFGTFTVVFGLVSLFISFMHDRFAFIPAAILAGLAADMLRQRLRPTTARIRMFHLFAFAVPVIFYALYFAALALTDGIGWSVHLWVGAIFMAGIAGLLLSYLVAPRIPRADNN